MPLREPELSEPYYGGAFHEVGYTGADAIVVQYFYTEDDDLLYDPDAGDPEWLTLKVVSSWNGDFDWSTDQEKRRLGTAILMHHLQRDPTEDELDLFMSEIAPTLQAGIPFEIGVKRIEAATGCASSVPDHLQALQELESQ
jgi:hypothetical protein